MTMTGTRRLNESEVHIDHRQTRPLESCHLPDIRGTRNIVFGCIITCSFMILPGEEIVMTYPFPSIHPMIGGCEGRISINSELVRDEINYIINANGCWLLKIEIIEKQVINISSIAANLIRLAYRSVEFSLYNAQQPPDLIEIGYILLLYRDHLQDGTSSQQRQRHICQCYSLFSYTTLMGYQQIYPRYVVNQVA